MAILAARFKLSSQAESIQIDFTRWLFAEKTTISSVVVNADAGVTVTHTHAGGIVALLLAGGVKGKSYTITTTIMAANGKVKSAPFVLKISKERLGCECCDGCGQDCCKDNLLEGAAFFHTVSDCLMQGIPSISAASLSPQAQLVYFTSVLYPLLVEDRLMQGIPSISAGYKIDTTNDALRQSVPTISAGNLGISIAYYTIDATDQLTQGVPYITAAMLETSVSYKLVNADDALRQSVPTLSDGSLNITISYVQKTIQEQKLTQFIPTITAGSLT